MPKTYCQGFCTQCGTGCTEHMNLVKELRDELKRVSGYLRYYKDKSQRMSEAAQHWKREIEKELEKIRRKRGK